MVDRPALTGFWLPGLDLPDGKIRERAFGPDEVPVALPELDPDSLRTVLRGLRRRRADTLARASYRDVVEAVARAASLLTAPGARYREGLLDALPGLTGYSPEMIDVGLEKMAESWTRPALEAALTGEFDDPKVLDEFRPRVAGGRYRAYGPALSVHIFSGNIPGVSVTSLIRALCVKSASLGKSAEGEPYLAVCFARALGEVDRDLAECVAVTYWPGGDRELEAVAFEEAEAVIAYGADASLADIRGRLPAGKRFLGYPNRVGAAVVARQALATDAVEGLARAAAQDVVIFDQQGCVAPHVLLVERGGAVDPQGFARRLAEALSDLSDTLPRGAIDPGVSAMIHQVRGAAEVRGSTVFASEGGTAWTVIFEETGEFEPSPLNRVVRVYPVDDLMEACDRLEPVGRHLQTVGVAGPPKALEPLVDRVGAMGATRIVPVGSASWPAPHWHHDGRFQFLDLVRFTDLEPD